MKAIIVLEKRVVKDYIYLQQSILEVKVKRLIFVVAVAIIFISCSSNLPQTFVGNWKGSAGGVEYTYTLTETSIEQGQVLFIPPRRGALAATDDTFTFRYVELWDGAAWQAIDSSSLYYSTADTTLGYVLLGDTLTLSDGASSLTLTRQ
jgi:hypothetical protein